MTTPAIIAVVGGGASGCLTAAHLVRAATLAGPNTDVLLIDPAPPGRGLAYSTRDPRHRLNVPAKAMSAWPDDPDHFLRWMRRHVDADLAPCAFAARMHYADYLAAVLDETVRAAHGVRLERIAARTTDLRRRGRRLSLALDDGTTRSVDAVVLATGHGAPSTAWAPEALRRSSRFVADPWRVGDEPAVAAGDQVLLVGAGLTAVDMAMRWERAGVRVHITSRHGMLPLPHANEPEPPMTPASLPSGPLSLGTARRLVFEHIREVGDWRRAVDGLRPVTSQLWSQLDDAARRTFVANAARRWDRARHRIDPSVHAWLDQCRGEGAVQVHAGSVLDTADGPDGLEVTLSNGSRLVVAAVLNCTGTCNGVCSSGDPMVVNLLESGLARPGSLDLGLDVDDAGRLHAAAGPQPAVWTIGPLRRGQLWESTAIAEIRAQAEQLAGSVLAALRSPRVARRAA